MRPDPRTGPEREVRIVRGEPTDEEIAALTLALTVALARPVGRPAERAGRRGGWADRAYGFSRRPCPSRLHSPGCW